MVDEPTSSNVSLKNIRTDNVHNHYRTANTALATYLQTEGFTLDDVILGPHAYLPGQNEAVFLFQDAPSIRDFVRLWQTGKAEGNLNVFFDTYRVTVKRAKTVVSRAKLLNS